MLQIFLVFVTMLFLIFLGFPIFVSLLVTGIIFTLAMDIPPSLVAIKVFGSLDSFALMAIPFFILAGNLMSAGKITNRLVDLANSVVGCFKGGLGHVNILASALFGSIQGSGAADASAIGGILIPTMVKQGYSPEYSVAVTTASSMLSPIIPPSIAMILYSYYTDLPVGTLFLAGYLPGVILMAGMMLINHFFCRNLALPTTKFTWQNLKRSLAASIGALIMPLIIVGGIVFGIVSPTEAGILAILYGLFYGLFISRDLKVEAIPRILLDSAITTAVVMMTIAAAGVVGNVFVRMRFQDQVLNFAVNTIGHPYLATFFIMLILVILGCFLDPTVLIAMFAPSMLRIGNALGFNPIHYGLLMVIVMQMGAITPPVGTFFFISCSIARLPLEKSIKPLMPFILLIISVAILILYVPSIATFLPSLLGKLR